MKPEGAEQYADQADDKNLMPSMVVRQQRIQMGFKSANQTKVGKSGQQQTDSLQPVPSLSSSSLPIRSTENVGAGAQPTFDQDGLVVPKKVLHHPISAAQPIFKDLNRELKFNQVRGKNVLEQKSELKRVLERLEDNKKKREAEQERLNRRTSLELRLEERAERIAKETSKSHPDAPSSTTGSCDLLSNFGIKSSITR